MEDRHISRVSFGINLLNKLISSKTDKNDKLNEVEVLSTKLEFEENSGYKFYHIYPKNSGIYE